MTHTQARFAPLHWVFVPADSQDGKDIAALDESWVDEDGDVDVHARGDFGIGLVVDADGGDRDWMTESIPGGWDLETNGHQDLFVIRSYEHVRVNNTVGPQNRSNLSESGDNYLAETQKDGREPLELKMAKRPRGNGPNGGGAWVDTPSHHVQAQARKESRERLELRMPKRPKTNGGNGARMALPPPPYLIPDPMDEPSKNLCLLHHSSPSHSCSYSFLTPPQPPSLEHTFHLRYSHAPSTKPRPTSTSTSRLGKSRTPPLARVASNHATGSAAFPNDVVQAFWGGSKPKMDTRTGTGRVVGGADTSPRLGPRSPGARPAKRTKDPTATNTSTQPPASKRARLLPPSSPPSSSSPCSFSDPDADVDLDTATTTAPILKAQAQPRRRSRLVRHAHATPQLDLDGGASTQRKREVGLAAGVACARNEMDVEVGRGGSKGSNISKHTSPSFSASRRAQDAVGKAKTTDILRDTSTRGTGRLVPTPTLHAQTTQSGRKSHTTRTPLIDADASMSTHSDVSFPPTPTPVPVPFLVRRTLRMCRMGGRQEQEQGQGGTTRHAPTKPASKLGTGTVAHVPSRRATAPAPQTNAGPSSFTSGGRAPIPSPPAQPQPPRVHTGRTYVVKSRPWAFRGVGGTGKEGGGGVG
ncbi:hypothetical protein M427DRAFT_28636 [Gonapodya prolifera JEL478]|uniref:Uncharacterized protein n=1 Tax=Gonapodya prolifera (strain JEL478) TaxID=1344416 RepID=A0A139ASL9_GONPJ|nr:hypothetical protein M427DRAFT_28636 [Gonapodya prolifera JEL478]|eukprot:KXS19699.1 hypothetical protein M427DRAFT_28636 [Gonapodya prolifera JEL478]